MKIRKLVKKYYEAILTGQKRKQYRLWKKLLKKSLEGKKTHVIK